MKNKLICGLLTLGLISSSIATFSGVEANAAEITTKTVTGAGTIQPKTAYNWYVYDVGVDSQSQSQVRGPLSGGRYNTESIVGFNRTFNISWSGAPSDASFAFYAEGVDNGNEGSTNWSNGCEGESGSTKLSIPYADRGYIKIYVYSTSDSTIKIDEIHLDSR